MSEPLVISQDAAVVNHVQSSAAAANQPLRITQLPEEVRRYWSSASLVIVGVDCAAMVAGLGLTERHGVHIVGHQAEAVLTWSVPLAAPGLVLPGQAGFLAALLDESHRQVSAPALQLRFAGATGGLGVSTLTSGLAVRAARRGQKVALVELDLDGGGLDVLMGAETEPGWRWHDLTGARGHLGDLSDHLPKTCGVSIVAAGRTPPPLETEDRATSSLPAADSVPRPAGPSLTLESMSAVLASLRRSHDLVFIDQGSTASPHEEVIWIVGADVRAVLAAQSILARGSVATRRVIRRTGPGRRLPADLMAESLGLPVIGTITHDHRLPGALAAGDPPGRSLGTTSRSLDQILDHLIESHRAANHRRPGAIQTLLDWSGR